jgi:hypothetical protein
MGNHGLGQNVGINQFGARQAAPQPSFGSQNPGMGSQEAQSVARYIEQQRALEAANHQAQQQKLLHQHRVFQMQVNISTLLDADLFRLGGGGGLAQVYGKGHLRQGTQCHTLLFADLWL